MAYPDSKKSTVTRIPILPVGPGNIVGAYSDQRTKIHGELWKPANKQYIQLILENPLAAEPGEQSLHTEMYITQMQVYEVGDDSLCAIIEADFPDELNPYWFFVNDYSQDFSDETKAINRGMSGLLRTLANSRYAQQKGRVGSVSEAKAKAKIAYSSRKYSGKQYLTAIFQKQSNSVREVGNGR